jgi:hypothetical protein
MKSIIFIITFLISASYIYADKNEDINSHPATKVTFQYLKNAMGQDWDAAAELIEPLSLENLKARYIMKIKASATFDEEIARVRKVDCSNLREVERLKPVDFYVRYHKGVQQRFKVDQSILDKILASLAVKLLSLAEDNIDKKEFCHILVRTRHSNGDKQISALDLVSLVKIKGNWKVTLNAQQPVVKKVESPPK